MLRNNLENDHAFGCDGRHNTDIRRFLLKYLVGLPGKTGYSGFMKNIIYLSVLLSLAPFNWAVAETLTGTATAINGNHLKIGGVTVKLLGIDAPDLGQTCMTRKKKTKFCGQLARQYLAHMLENRQVKCMGDQRSSDRVLAATCIIGPFRVNEQMVMNGWAMADPNNGELYKRAELFAQIRKEGMWRGTFQKPWEWRQDERNKGR